MNDWAGRWRPSIRCTRPPISCGEVASDRGLDAVDDEGNRWDNDFTAWQFKDEAGAGDRGEVDSIELEFWSGHNVYDVAWKYDREANFYRRTNGGTVHKDLNTDQQLQAQNVVVLFMQEKGPIDDLKHLLYTTEGSGRSLVFQDGKAIEGKWAKQDRQSRTKLTNASGAEISFNRGLIWLEIVPVGKKVVY